MWLRCRKHINKMSGTDAEKLAGNYLKQQGMKILHTNYTTRRGEIDLIGSVGNTLLFIEVKYRTKNHFGSAAESVTYRKQQKIISAASHYLQKHQLAESAVCRFDVVTVFPKITDANKKSQDIKNQYRVEWLKNAFEVT